jgi:hypothetical protein
MMIFQYLIYSRNKLLGVWIIVNQNVHILGSLLLSSGSTKLLVKILVPVITVLIGKI